MREQQYNSNVLTPKLSYRVRGDEGTETLRSKSQAN